LVFAMRLLEPKKPLPTTRERHRLDKTPHLVEPMRLLVFAMRRREDKLTHLENKKTHRVSSPRLPSTRERLLLFKTTHLLFKMTHLFFKTTRSSNEEPLFRDTMTVSLSKMALLLEKAPRSSTREPHPVRRTRRRKVNEPRREHSDTNFVIPRDHDEDPMLHRVDPNGRLVVITSASGDFARAMEVSFVCVGATGNRSKPPWRGTTLHPMLRLLLSGCFPCLLLASCSSPPEVPVVDSVSFPPFTKDATGTYTATGTVAAHSDHGPVVAIAIDMPLQNGVAFAGQSTLVSPLTSPYSIVATLTAVPPGPIPPGDYELDVTADGDDGADSISPVFKYTVTLQ
ncbi:MAG TPA: hypothetical protein VGL81_23945, partial [Polyangiaceae bacterium]